MVAASLRDVAALLVKADTAKRINFVWKSLNDTQKLQLLSVVFNAVGLDNWKQKAREANVEAPNDVLEILLPNLTSNTVVDGYIPWLSNKLRGGVSEEQLESLVHKFLPIANWASESKTDIGPLSVDEVLAKLAARTPKKKTPKQSKIADENPVVYTFGDGWFIRNLITDQALKTEGDTLQHCVGTYCSRVREGTSVIFSLRNPNDEPQVTMELDPKTTRFKQMYGFEDSKPKDEVKKYLIEFVDTKYPSDKIGLMLAGKPAKDIDLKGADLTYAKLTSADLTKANLSGANLRGAILRYADLTDADLTGAILTSAILTKAILTGAILTGAKYDEDTKWPDGFDMTRLE